MTFRLPLVYLVDSAGVFLPLQDEIFPDEDDFGRIFRNNAVISASRIPQYAAVMGNCVAGGAYLPVLSDTLLITEGSQMYLAAPALVKAAIGQDATRRNSRREDARRHQRHSPLSRVDHISRLRRLRSPIDMLPRVCPAVNDSLQPQNSPEKLCELVSGGWPRRIRRRDLLACIVDAGTIEEYREVYGRTIVTAFARIGGRAVGAVANQWRQSHSAGGEIQIGGVLYGDSAGKSCPLRIGVQSDLRADRLLSDAQGSMVGKQAEQSGIIRSGAKLVNVVSNSVVPKFTVIVGGSFGLAVTPFAARPTTPAYRRLAVRMPDGREPGRRYAFATPRGGGTRRRAGFRRREQRLRDEYHRRYEEQTDIRYGAARGWVDAIIAPHETW